MTVKDHSRLSAVASFVRSSELSIKDRKAATLIFREKVAEMTLKVDQCHWRWC